MPRVTRQSFDHVGIVTDLQQPGETWVPATQVWVTSPRAHSHHVEFLRFHPESPVVGPVRTQPHVAYRVADLDAAIAGAEVLLEPFVVGNGFARVAFVRVDGAVIEYMQYANPEEEGWF